MMQNIRPACCLREKGKKEEMTDLGNREKKVGCRDASSHLFQQEIRQED